jgi:hypothetical protein
LAAAPRKIQAIGGETIDWYEMKITDISSGDISFQFFS